VADSTGLEPAIFFRKRYPTLSNLFVAKYRAEAMKRLAGYDDDDLDREQVYFILAKAKFQEQMRVNDPRALGEWGRQGGQA